MKMLYIVLGDYVYILNILFLKVCVLSVTVSVETRACEPYRESLLNSLFLLFGWKLFEVTHVYIQSLLGKVDTVMC